MNNESNNKITTSKAIFKKSEKFGVMVKNRQF